ncbi:MAG: hypothetical protein COA45_01020 [Zetaproteobacteria bacterium]|nr:MAG: hypothetical protein COA45_01020 [Zetaproteobacteria bacterium]
MMIMRSFLLLGFALTFSSSVSAGVNDRITQGGQYWQRVHTSSAIYLRGPKAQQMLNRNIARCVTELRELERLGAVKDAIPEYADGLVLSTEEAELAGWDTPERDKELFAEHSDYIDFEGCMIAKGWERIQYVPFDVAGEARENYKMTHQKTRVETRKKGYGSKRVKDYDNLNE